MHWCTRRRLLALALFVILPAAHAAAQEATITGVARDVSGGFLPGVSVRVSSPALIERVRTATTDGAGQYRITNLVPGLYSIIFTLPGFTTVRRDAIELLAETTVAINADMTVSQVQETIVITAASPVVDTQNVATRTVMTRDVMDAIPTGRNIQAIGIMIPGTALSLGGGAALSRDVGGSGGLQQSPLIFRGNPDSVQTVEGLRLNNLCANGAYSGNYWNDGMFQEISYSTGADSAEMGQGGLRINMIPKDGGNTFRGTIFGNYTGGSGWNADNLTQRLQDRGITNVSRVQRIYDINPSIGGPIAEDRLWFQATFRRNGLEKTVVDSFFDADPDPIKYVADESRPGVDDGYIMSSAIRLTWQASERNKFTGYFDLQDKSRGHWGISANNPPEASAIQETPRSFTGNVKWHSSLTSRLLLEAGYAHYYQRYDEIYQPTVTASTYRITDQVTGKSCCAYVSNQEHYSTLRTYSADLTYVTGSHSLSGGWTVSEGPRRTVTRRTGDINMRFGATTVNANASGFGPNQVTLFLPTDQREGIYMDSGLWINDKWTYRRATLTAGLRFDWFVGETLESTINPSVWSAGATFPGRKDVPNWKDLSPRLGVAYDLFGTGRTAVKFSASRYVDAETVAFAAANNSISLLDNNEALTWTDNNGDFTIFNADGSVQDSQFNPNTTANELAPLPASSTFGNIVEANARTDDAIRSGWFVRGYEWEFTGGIQHELLPRVSVLFNYYRRYTGGNETVVDNLNVGPEDYNGPFCINAPSDARLPDSGGFAMCGVYELTQAAFDRPADNFETFAKDLGVEPIQYSHGFELSMNARLPGGTFVQGGVNAHRAINDDCYQAAIGDPEAAMVNPITGQKYCHDVTPFRPDVKILASHNLPWDIQVSGTYQHVAGQSVFASWVYSQSVANANGFTLTTASGSSAAQRLTANRTIQILQTGQTYADSLNQLDLRVAKRFRAGTRARLQVMADLYNAFNSDWVFSQNNVLGVNSVSSTWLRPTNVLQARMLKVGAQLDW
jgi:hypothetical protein